MIRGKSLPPQMGQRSIDVWWRGRQNGSLMLLLAHMLQHSIGWTSARIRILRVVPREVEKEPALTDLRNIMEEARVEAEPVVIVTEASFREVLQQHSMQATTVFLGFATPEPEESQAWRDMYEELLEGMPTTLMVQALDEEDKALLG